MSVTNDCLFTSYYLGHGPTFGIVVHQLKQVGAIQILPFRDRLGKDVHERILLECWTPFNQSISIWQTWWTYLEWFQQGGLSRSNDAFHEESEGPLAFSELLHRGNLDLIENLVEIAWSHIDEGDSRGINAVGSPDYIMWPAIYT